MPTTREYNKSEKLLGTQYRTLKRDKKPPCCASLSLSCASSAFETSFETKAGAMATCVDRFYRGNSTPATGAR